MRNTQGPREYWEVVFRVSAFLMIAGALALLPQLADGQRYSPSADPDSPEGTFLELISLQSDGTKRLALCEQFTQRYPRHPAVAWAYEQLQEAAFQAKQWDKVLTFGGRLTELNPDDIDAAEMNLNAARGQSDHARVKFWSDYISRLSQRILASPPPKSAEQLEEWNKRIATASQYAAQNEYVLYRKALDASDPRQQIKSLDELLRQNPNTPYLRQALLVYLNAYRAVGDSRNALLTAEKVLTRDQNNEDALLLCAEAYQQRGGAPDTVLAYSTRIIQLMSTNKKPAGVRQEDWDKKRTSYTGIAHWMIGNVYITQNRFSQADTALRTALSLLGQSNQQVAPVLFYLGWANYKLERFAEAARFFKQCIAIPSQFQDQAAKNLGVIRSEHGVQ